MPSVDIVMPRRVRVYRCRLTNETCAGSLAETLSEQIIAVLASEPFGCIVDDPNDSRRVYFVQTTVRVEVK